MIAQNRLHQFTLRAGATFLILLSLCAALPIHPQGPFDARDYSVIPGIRLEFPGHLAMVEPLMAPLHILAGAPDYRLACLSTLIWVVIAAAAWRFLGVFQTQQPSSLGIRILRAAATAGISLSVILLWFCFTLAVRIPGWRLVVDDPHTLVADLHSHTFGSHDGLVSGPESLANHAAAGFNVVAISEHGYPAGAFNTERDKLNPPASTPGVITGQEFLFSRSGGHWLALGLKSDYQNHLNRHHKDFPSCFIDYIHQNQHGAMIAMGYKLRPDEAQMLADAGIDGFEIANFGHPNLPSDVREAIVNVARERGVALVASSDWHGWGGVSRTWTVIRNPASPKGTQISKSDQVIQKLRERGTSDVIPVVAGYLGPPSIWRVVFSPFTETFRYAAELSLARVISWWVWMVVLLGFTQGLTRIGLNSSRVLISLLLTTSGSSLLGFGLKLISLKPDGLNLSQYPQFVGKWALLLSGLALAAAAWFGLNCWRVRLRPKK